jgi:hypothetical protein
MEPPRPMPVDIPAASAGPARRRWWRSPAARTFLVLVVIAIILACLHVWFWTLIIRTVPDPALSPYVGWWRAFDVGGEANLPTWFSVALWFFAAAVVAVYSLVGRHRWTWRLLAFTCLLLSVDEAAMLHENLHHLGVAMGVDRWAPSLPYTWVVPGALAALLLVALYVRAVLRLPLAQRLLVLLAGLVFVGGAIGVEILGGLAMGNGAYLAYTVLTGVEEVLEMAGVALFACTMFSLLAISRDGAGVLRIELAAAQTPRRRVAAESGAAGVDEAPNGSAFLDGRDRPADSGTRPVDPVLLADRRSA